MPAVFALTKVSCDVLLVLLLAKLLSIAIRLLYGSMVVFLLKSQLLVSLHGDFIQLLAVPEVCMIPGEPSEPATHLNGLQTGIPLVAILCPERRELFSYGIMDHVQGF